LRIDVESETLGVIYFSYRNKIDFNLSTNGIENENIYKFITQFLANLVGRIVNIYQKLNEYKKVFQIQSSNAIYRIKSEYALGAFHNFQNIQFKSSLKFNRLKDAFDKMQYVKVGELIIEMNEILNSLDNDYNLYKNFITDQELNIDFFNLKSFYFELDRLISFTTKNKNIEIKILPCNEHVEILGDKHQLYHVFINFILNSVQAKAKLIEIDIDLEKDINFNIIRVSDNGKGIDENIRSEIFNPLFTTKIGGTGMGLPFVKRIIDLHKGRIELIPNRTKKGNYTTFKIYLPKLKNL
ncbi:MAG: ATP-binding protein, partial [Flavobacterium sp.]|nr:ATP-binding protein [Flavobacterium sp.]